MSKTSEWKTFRFEEFAENVRETVDPTFEDSERYIGLEHLDTGSLHIHRWGTDIILKGKKLRMKKGDILFAKRNAYLRRVSIAPFDGIFSAHGMVLRPKEDVILPEYFPHFLQSEIFFEHALAISVGSLSPTINWKTLAKQEFSLPPNNEQRRIAEILWAVDDAVEKYRNLREVIQRNQIQLSISLMNNGLYRNNKNEIEVASPFQTKKINKSISKTWKAYKLFDLIQSADNGFASGERDENGIVQLRMNNITRSGRFLWKDITRLPENIADIDMYLLKPGDIVFNNTNSEDLVGKSAYFEGYCEDVVFSNHFTRIRVKPNVLLPKYLSFWLRSKFFIGLFSRRCQRWVGQAAVQIENLLQLEMLIPPIDEQIEIIKILELHEQEFRNISSQVEILMVIKKYLLERLISL